jgi:hypothetical protein
LGSRPAAHTRRPPVTGGPVGTGDLLKVAIQMMPHGCAQEGTMRSVKPLLAAACLLLLAGCGNSRNNAAVDACSKAIADKISGKSFTLERKDMVSHAKDESTDVVSIASTIVFDKGLSTEYQQTFDCRVRFDKDKVSDVIHLQFNWNKDDLKKVNAGDG